VHAAGMETLLRVSQTRSSRCTDKAVPPATGILSFVENLLELSVFPYPPFRRLSLGTDITSSRDSFFVN
jgi:hypothetical protein